MIVMFLDWSSLLEGSADSYIALRTYNLHEVLTLWVAIFLTRPSCTTGLLGCPIRVQPVAVMPPCFLHRLQCFLVQWTSPFWVFLGIRESIDSIFLVVSAPFNLFLLGSFSSASTLDSMFLRWGKVVIEVVLPLPHLWTHA